MFSEFSDFNEDLKRRYQDMPTFPSEQQTPLTNSDPEGLII